MVPLEELDAAAEKLALQIARASPLTLAMGKRAFYDQVERSETEAYNLVTPVMALNLAMDDAQEGVNAFLAKREPKWTGR